MKILKDNKIVMLAAALCSVILCMTSCRERFPVIIDSDEKESFFYSEREGLYSGGQALFLLNDSTHQKSYNTKRLQYRIQTDMQDTCLNVIFESTPRNTGVHITTELDYRSPETVISNTTIMECSKISDGKYWFWDSYDKTGIILRLRQ